MLFIFLFQKENLENMTLLERLKNIPTKTPYDYIAEIIGPELQDGCNLSDDDENDETDNGDTKSLKSSISGLNYYLFICFIFMF